RVSPGLRVLYMSGYSERFLGRVDPRSLSEHTLLPKPFGAETLLARVEEVLASPVAPMPADGEDQGQPKDTKR
ncbi:MAG: hypothetical protein RBU30_06200, partial [Polyangia bacterium]|nr:hypothetical protein [Polyangia bacterium]